MLFRNTVLFLTSATMLGIVTPSFSQERMQTKPVPHQVPAQELQMKQPVQPGPGSGLEKRDARSACPKLTFVTSSPLPSTGLGWDYKCQLQVSGGHPPIFYRAYFMNPATLKESLGQYVSVLGLTITPSGLIQGQPEQAGYHILRIVVEDSCLSGVQRIEKKFALEVKGPAK